MKDFRSIVNKRYDVYAICMLALVYLLGLGTEPAFGDASSFTLSAIKGFDFATNATSHLLYGLTLRLVGLLFGVQQVLWAFPLVSTLFAIAALFMLNQSLKKLDFSIQIRTWVLLIFGFSFTFWRNAECTEVYAYNTFLCSAFLLFVLKWHETRNTKFYISGTLVLGVSTWLHIQNILWIPALMYWSALVFKSNKPAAVFGCVAFLALFFVLFIPPLLLDTNTISAIFFDNGFQDQVLAFDLKVLAKGLLMALGFLILNFTIFTIPAFMTVLKNRLHQSLNVMLWLLFFFTFGFAARYNVTDNYVFFLPAYLVGMIWLALGLEKLSKKYGYFTKRIIVFTSLVLPFTYAALTMVIKNLDRGKEIDVEKSYKGGVAFYTWPPMRGNPGIIKLIEKVESKEIKIDANTEIEPNYKMAKELDSLLK